MRLVAIAAYFGKKDPMISVRPIAAIATLVISAGAATGAARGSAYSPNRSALPVASVETVRLHDAKRNKDLEVKAYYPQMLRGRLPVIIWSHGAGGSKDSYAPLLSSWASYGYICLAPSHSDSRALKAEFGQPQPQSLPAIVYDAGHNANEWRERPADVSFIIDELPSLGRYVAPLKDHIDLERIGVGGHSFGAHTTELIAGATIRTPGDVAPESFRDKRARAFLIVSPPPSGLMGTSASSWSTLNGPAMVVTGTRDYAQNGLPPESRKIAFESLPAGEKYFVTVDGANHFSFASPIQTPVLGDVETVSLAFWDAYLRGDAGARAFLAHPYLEDFTPALTLDSR